MRKRAGWFFCCLFFIFSSCKSAKEQGKNQAGAEENKQQTTAVKQEKALDFSAGPPTIVYKTREDYRMNVAVTLSDDKTEVIAYPQPNDVFYNGLPAYPYPLKNGYLLDNRGINKHTAFIKMNYEAYSKLNQPPSLLELYELVIDKNPIVEMCDCGNRNQFRNEIAELNNMITDSMLNKCKKIK